MRNLLVLITLFSMTFVFSQEKLTVEYEYKMLMDDDAIAKKTEKMMSGSNGPSSRPEIAKAIVEAMMEPKHFEMTMTSGESEYKDIEKLSNEQPSEGGFKISVSTGMQGIIYKNLNEHLSLKTANNWGKDFLIQDSLQVYDWKITRESREILGQEVRKATAELGEGNTVEAWYAPRLPYRNGPDEFHGLPGLILEVTLTTLDKEGEEDKRFYSTTSINVAKDNSEIKRPTKGKKVSRQEFKDFVKEQYEKRKEMYGGGVDKD